MQIAVVIPAYNAEKTVGRVISKIQKTLPKANIILVDDGSRDGTVDRSRKMGITVLSHSENKGKGAALKTGFQKALQDQAEAILTLDADGQHDPESIIDFINLMEKESYDVVIGSRMKNRETMPFHRILSNKITSALVSWRIGQPVEDSQSGFRLIKMDVLRTISLQTNHFDTESELLLKAGLKGYRIGMVTIKTIYNHQKSSIHHVRDTLRFILLMFRSLFW